MSETMMPTANEWLVHCRPGYESVCAAELTEKLRDRGFPAVYAIAKAGHAWLRLLNPLTEDEADMGLAVPAQCIFPRQIVPLWQWLDALPTDDRVGAILAALPPRARFSGLQLSSPDSNDGKSLNRLLRPLEKALRQGLKQAGIGLDDANAPCLHLFLPDGQHAGVGFTPDPSQAPGGIRRLRMPSTAPSRSTLKLDEALQVLLSSTERERLLQPGQTAVDLGAAPGGWSWQMVRRHIHVTAVDNGPMDASLLDSGLVHHVRADGFSWAPPRPVDWLLCDIVDKPGRVSHRMGQWLTKGWARHAVFNLKLPMKQAWPTVRNLLGTLDSVLRDSRPDITLRARQLYHDREEITVLAISDANNGGSP
jgi:23S rRNA (cytidine2498-2'-O)-methyltransferase